MSTNQQTSTRGGNALDRNAKLSWGEKIGFGLGDAGFNFYWAIIGSYLVFFYTDVFGISAAAAATMVTFTKIIDAVTDPVIGGIADRTNTRWGKFRPYLIWGALPMMGAGILTMSTPDLGDTGKLIWAYATYSLLMLCYTILNMPYRPCLPPTLASAIALTVRASSLPTSAALSWVPRPPIWRSTLVMATVTAPKAGK